MAGLWLLANPAHNHDLMPSEICVLKPRITEARIQATIFDSLVREEENILHEDIINDEDTVHAIVAPSSGEKIKSGFKI